MASALLAGGLLLVGAPVKAGLTTKGVAHLDTSNRVTTQAFTVTINKQLWQLARLGRTWNTERSMADAETLAELDAAIAAIRDNIRELIEQAAAYSGAADEERTADRLAKQEARLEELLKKRKALAG
jgi:hypothetical protein